MRTGLCVEIGRVFVGNFYFAAVSTPEELNCAPPNQYCIIILAVAFVAAADEHSVLYI